MYYNDIMVKLVTVATESQGYMPWLLESCKKHKTQITILGWQEKWQGFKWRYQLMLNYLDTIDGNELICFIDAYDVILLRPLEEIIEYYEKYDREIIISSEKMVSEYMEKMFGNIRDSFFTQCDKKRINAGLYLSRCKYLKLILRDILKNYDKKEYNNDDQIMITKHCENNKQQYHIDDKFEIFLTVFNPMLSGKLDNMKIKNGKLFYGKNNPFFIHGNGNTRMDDIIRELGYEMNLDMVIKSNMHNIYTVIFKKCPEYSKQYLGFNVIHLMAIAIILMMLYYNLYHKNNKY